MSNPQCRGSYVLGTACGQCRRCESELLALVMKLMDETPCQYDHHGYCQEHGLYSAPCPHSVAQQVMNQRGKKRKDA